MNNISPCTKHVTQYIKKLPEFDTLPQRVCLRLLNLMQQITTDDTVYPYIDVINNEGINLFWTGGDMHIIIDIQNDGDYFWDIKNVLPERKNGYSNEIPIRLLAEALHKFSSIVTENNPRWRELFITTC